MVTLFHTTQRRLLPPVGLFIATIASCLATGTEVTTSSGPVRDDVFNASHHCHLSRSEPLVSTMLDLCEPYNALSCCLPSHDAVIIEAFDSFTALGRTCSVSNNPRTNELARLLCMGCNPEQPKFTTVAEGKKEIRICEEFAAQFWNQNDLDACGLRIKDGSNDPYIMVPRSLHDNFTAFMNGAFAGRIPGFDASWKIRVVASNAEAEEGTCFAGESGGRLSAGRVGLVICMTMSLGILWVPARIL